jgi:hypothetical protein
MRVTFSNIETQKNWFSDSHGIFLIFFPGPTNFRVKRMREAYSDTENNNSNNTMSQGKCTSLFFYFG